MSEDLKETLEKLNSFDMYMTTMEGRYILVNEEEDKWDSLYYGLFNLQMNGMGYITEVRKLTRKGEGWEISVQEPGKYVFLSKVIKASDEIINRIKQLKEDESIEIPNKLVPPPPNGFTWI